MNPLVLEEKEKGQCKAVSVDEPGVAVATAAEHPTETGPITLFLCGPSKCEHDYSTYEPIIDSDGRACGETAVCAKCGVTAIDEAMWL